MLDVSADASVVAAVAAVVSVAVVVVAAAAKEFTQKLKAIVSVNINVNNRFIGILLLILPSWAMF